MKSEIRTCGQCREPSFALKRVYFGTLSQRDYACGSCANKTSVGTIWNPILLVAIPLVAYPTMFFLNAGQPIPFGAFVVGALAIAYALWEAQKIVAFNKTNPMP